MLWDGNGLVAERSETVREPRPHRLRLISANPDYTSYNPPREDKVMSGRISVILSGTPAGMRRAETPYSPKRTQAPFSWRPVAGYGTLVVGMPLWFAVPPDDPFRAENAIDDFMTRTELGLEDVTRRVLLRRDCPFRKVVVVWDTTPQALREWRKGRSSEYGDAANASLENPMGVALWGVLSDGLENAISKTGTPESEAPSMSLHLDMETNKKASGMGPYPELVEAFGEVLREGNEHPVGRWLALKSKVALTLLKLLCFVRIHGVEGLERRITRKLSVSHAWRRRAARRTARRLYRESRRRGRAFGARGHRYGVDGRGRGARVHGNAGQALGRGDA